MGSLSAPACDSPIDTNKAPSLSATNPINGSISSVSSTSIDTEAKTKHFKSLAPKNHKETNAAAVREAKAEIRSKLREDWEFPASVPLSSLLDNEDIQWIPRESDTEPSTPASTEDVDPPPWDNPDPFVQPVANGGKRKRQDQINAELGWNQGLRHFIEQRDAWTGARPHTPLPSNDQPHPPIPDAVTTTDISPTDALLPPPPSDTSLTSDLMPTKTTSQQPPNDTSMIATSPTTTALGPPSDTPILNSTCPTSSTSPTSSRTTLSSNSIVPPLSDSSAPPPSPSSPPNPTTPAYPSTHHETIIPVAPPLLPPTNPIRASITPSTYPSIYTKIAIQGLTPTIPINLSDMVSALVEGWTRDGEWPPKPTSNGAAFTNTRRRSTHLRASHPHTHTPKRVVRRSVGKVKRALGIGSMGAEESEGQRLDKEVDRVEGIVQGGE